MVDGRAIKALQIGGPLAGILPAGRLDIPFDFDAARGRGLHGRPRRHRRVRRAHRHAGAGARICCASARTRAAASASRAASACERALRDVPAATRRSTARGFEALLETLEVGEPVRPRRRHAGADAKPRRALPRGAGARLMRVTIDGHRARGRGRQRRVLEAIHAAGRDGADALLRRAPGAVRRLPRRAWSAPAGAPGSDPGLHDPVPRRDGDRHARRDGAPGRTDGRRAGALGAADRAAGAEHRAGAEVAASLGLASPRAALARVPTHAVDHDERHPYLAFQHELCISCGRCVRACDEVQGAFALTATGRGFTANVTAGLDCGFQRLQPACRAAPAPTPARRTRSPRSTAALTA